MWGVIEGFYGTPWTWEVRAEVCRHLAGHGMDTWIYAPKDDPLHRDRWREPYGDDFLADLSGMVDSQPMTVGFAVSPGLSLDPDSDSDRRALLAKLESVQAAGVRTMGVFFDDIAPVDGLGLAHGRVTAWVREHLDADIALFMAPLHYTGTSSVPYLAQLHRTLPAEVPVAWTGCHVVNDTISTADALAWSRAMGGRKPILWDNTPVNDALMSDRLFMAPLSGRDHDLPDVLGGYLANPMVQARASLPSLVAAAAWLRGEDPAAAFDASLGEAALLAECVHPRRLDALADRAVGADAGAISELTSFFADAVSCGDSGLGDDVRPWVDQVRAEAGVAQLALTVLADPASKRAGQAALVLLMMWPPLRRAKVSVFGGRGGVRPVMGQDERSEWVPTGDCLTPPRNVVDRLVEAAFAVLP
ncbi:MAG: hypothetical protein GY812_12175 [Actinomycetia bacterium]|nr:hypothetical protein [Actinomycetes bacterium]